jgi:hypothetical protein
MKNIEEIIPKGWKLCSADFSIIAGGGNKPGSVMLVRDPDHKKIWHDAVRDIDCPGNTPELYASGCGMTFLDALNNAIKKAGEDNSCINCNDLRNNGEFFYCGVMGHTLDSGCFTPDWCPGKYEK